VKGKEIKLINAMCNMGIGDGNFALGVVGMF